MVSWSGNPFPPAAGFICFLVCACAAFILFIFVLACFVCSGRRGQTPTSRGRKSEMRLKQIQCSGTPAVTRTLIQHGCVATPIISNFYCAFFSSHSYFLVRSSSGRQYETILILFQNQYQPKTSRPTGQVINSDGTSVRVNVWACVTDTFSSLGRSLLYFRAGT